MTKLPIISSYRFDKILQRMGFVLIRQRGSHRIYRHSDGRQTIVPFHKGEDLSKGLLKSILNDIDLPVSEFHKLIKSK
jgi:predicted RNA binding protein YcfA (HicA-like mRNA interferase family)